MQTRHLGTTGLEVPILSFGASSLGQEFRKITIEEAMSSVRVALDNGMRLIDTSPFYGRGMSEIMLGSSRTYRVTITCSAQNLGGMT